MNNFYTQENGYFKFKDLMNQITTIRLRTDEERKLVNEFNNIRENKRCPMCNGELVKEISDQIWCSDCDYFLTIREIY